MGASRGRWGPYASKKRVVFGKTEIRWDFPSCICPRWATNSTWRLFPFFWHFYHSLLGTRCSFYLLDEGWFIFQIDHSLIENYGHRNSNLFLTSGRGRSLPHPDPRYPKWYDWYYSRNSERWISSSNRKTTATLLHWHLTDWPPIVQSRNILLAHSRRAFTNSDTLLGQFQWRVGHIMDTNHDWGNEEGK